MEELSEAFERARRAYLAECANVEARHVATVTHEKLRKLSPRGGHAKLPKASRQDWDWHLHNQIGFGELPFELQRDEVLAITGPRGVDGLAALRVAGFILLDWLAARGDAITVTKADSTRDNSYAVDFLATHLAMLDPGLAEPANASSGSDRASNAAFTIGLAYHAARSG